MGGERERDNGLAVPRIRIGEIVQIGIVVKDVRKAVERYTVLVRLCSKFFLPRQAPES